MYSRLTARCREEAAAVPHLKQTLVDFKGNAGISLQWIMFSSGGHVERPVPGGPLRHFSHCSGRLSPHQKCLMNSYHAPPGDAPVMPSDQGVHACTYRCGSTTRASPRAVVWQGLCTLTMQHRPCCAACQHACWTPHRKLQCC